jgi:hypothetical protein
VGFLLMCAGVGAAVFVGAGFLLLRNYDDLERRMVRAGSAPPTPPTLPPAEPPKSAERSHATPMPPALPTPPPPVVQKPKPVLQADFNPLGDPLPIAIGPRAKITVVHILDKGQTSAFEHTNTDHTKTLLWPADKVPPGSVMARLRLSNVGDTNAFNVVVRLRIATHTEGTTTTTMPPQGVTVTLPPVDLRAERQESAVIYLANRSTSKIASVWFPPAVSAQVQGDSEPTELPLRVTGFGLKITTTGEKSVSMSSVLQTAWPTSETRPTPSPKPSDP